MLEVVLPRLWRTLFPSDQKPPTRIRYPQLLAIRFLLALRCRNPSHPRDQRRPITVTLQISGLLYVVYEKRLRRRASRESFLSFLSISIQNCGAERLIPMRTARTSFRAYSSVNVNCTLAMNVCSEIIFLLPRSHTFSKSFFPKLILVSKALQACISSTCHLISLFQEVHISNTLKKHLLSMASHSLYNILSNEHFLVKRAHGNCMKSEQHPRRKSRGSISQNEPYLNDTEKSEASLFIPHPQACSAFCLVPASIYPSRSSCKPRWTSASTVLGVRFVLVHLRTLFTSSFDFAIVAVAHNREGCCDPEYDAHFGDVSLSFRDGLHGDTESPMTFSSTTNQLNGFIRCEFDVHVRVFVTIMTRCSYRECWNSASQFIQTISVRTKSYASSDPRLLHSSLLIISPDIPKQWHLVQVQLHDRSYLIRNSGDLLMHGPKNIRFLQNVELLEEVVHFFSKCSSSQ